MSTWINFQELRERITLEEIIFDLYGITNLKRDGDRLTGPCPIHNGDSPRSFSADLRKGVWRCFTKCQRGGNQLDFVAAKENISIRDAGLKLHAVFLEGKKPVAAIEKESETKEPRDANVPAEARPREIPASSTKSPKATAESKPTKNPPLGLELKLEPRHPHLVGERKLAPETIDSFGVGYCARGVLRGAIAIPIRDEEGVLVAYAGRRLKAEAIEKHGKYVFPKGFRKELVLYGYDRAKTAMTSEGLILVESFFSVMTLGQMGLRNTVAVMGCELSDAQADLAARAPEIIILFDGDDAGRKGTETAQAKLSGRTVVRVIRLSEGTKPDTLPAKAIRWAVNGVRALGIAELSFSFHTKPESAE